MSQHPAQALHRPRFDAAQRSALDAVGLALKRRTIDFCMATEFSDLVKAGRVAEVLRRLEAA